MTAQGWEDKEPPGDLSPEYRLTRTLGSGFSGGLEADEDDLLREIGDFLYEEILERGNLIQVRDRCDGEWRTLDARPGHEQRAPNLRPVAARSLVRAQARGEIEYGMPVPVAVSHAVDGRFLEAAIAAGHVPQLEEIQPALLALSGNEHASPRDEDDVVRAQKWTHLAGICTTTAESLLSRRKPAGTGCAPVAEPASFVTGREVSAERSGAMTGGLKVWGFAAVDFEFGYEGGPMPHEELEERFVDYVEDAAASWPGVHLFVQDNGLLPDAERDGVASDQRRIVDGVLWLLQELLSAGYVLTDEQAALLRGLG